MLLITVHSDINVYVIQAHQHLDGSEEALASCRQKSLATPSLNTGNSTYIHCILFQVNGSRGCIRNLPHREKGVKRVF